MMLDSFDPETSPGLAADYRTTVLGAVPSMMPAFFAAQRQLGDERLLPRLRLVFSGGSPVPVALHRQVKNNLGGVGVTSTWGLTEAPQVTFPPLDASDENLATTVGKAVPGVEIRVTDSDGRQCPAGVVGELRVRGPQMLLGYVDSVLDRQAIDDDGFLRTGDLGSLNADGYVRITGRVKDVIIRNGENISALEIEQILLTHESIADAAAIAVPDELTGERCCAIITLVPGTARLTLADLRQHFQAAGVARQKVPEKLVTFDEIPRNDMGKIQKQLLSQRVAEWDRGNGGRTAQ
jgi:non-ribosomal peptide synthetase component E (peptide arylation enzyme)